MYVFLSVLLTLCIVVIAALSIKLAAILTALKEINARLPEIVQGGTNKLICVSSADKNVKKLALTLNGQLTELRKKELVYTDGDREIKTALINAAHDLRTPLTVKSQPFYIIADKKDVDRLFSNVINNALKYSTGEFSVTAEGGKITFTNSAEGFDNIDAAKLFDRFYTVKNGRTSTGLGLSIAKTLCARMGGKIYATLSDGSLSVTLEF